MSQESNLAFKVGLFVLMALLGLAFFIFSVTDSSYFVKGSRYYILFSYANGVKKAAPVRIAGVDQGIVRSLKLIFDTDARQTQVLVEVWLPDEVKIACDSEILINQLGFMGEKYIEIMPGKAKDDFYNPGDTIRGSDPILQERLAQRVVEVANHAETALSCISNLVNDQENNGSLKNILHNFESASGNLDDMLQELRDGKGLVGKFLTDDSIYADLKELGSDLRQNPWKLLYRAKE